MLLYCSLGTCRAQGHPVTVGLRDPLAPSLLQVVLQLSKRINIKRSVSWSVYPLKLQMEKPKSFFVHLFNKYLSCVCCERDIVLVPVASLHEHSAAGYGALKSRHSCLFSSVSVSALDFTTPLHECAPLFPYLTNLKPFFHLYWSVTGKNCVYIVYI